MKNNILLFLCVASLSSTAQTVVSADAILSISPSGSFYSAGDFVNNGTVLNNGSLNISGAWTNSGDYVAEAGEVTFNGSGPQVINHNAQSFARLVISGGGEKLFKADITISQELTLTSGILSTDNNSKIILTDAATVAGGSNSSFVQGAVYAAGTGSKLFPVGINSTYLPVTLTNVTGTSPQVGVQVVEPNENKNITSELLSVSPVRFWKISNLGGSFTGSPVMLTLANESFVKSDNIVVVQADEDAEPFSSLGRADFTGSETDGTITSTGLVTKANIAAGELNSDIDKSIIIYNAVTPNGDNVQDFLKIANIEFYPSSEIVIANRWGDKVFQISGYNNDDRRFNGDGNVGGSKTLTDGTYYYVLDLHNGDKKITGFLLLKR